MRVSKVDGSDFPWCTSDAAATVCKSFDPVAGAGYPSLQHRDGVEVPRAIEHCGGKIE